MDRDTHVELFRSQAHGFADALGRADLGSAVPNCPEWTVRDLARHLGSLHRWAASVVEHRIVVETWRAVEPTQCPEESDDPEEWAAWIRGGTDEAVNCFLAADPGVRVWAWGADQHVRFWPRRMLVESAVHRFDLAAATGDRTELPAGLAVEAIDEFLENLRYAARWRPAIHGLVGNDERLTFRASDTGDSWHVRMTPSGWWWDRSSTQADVSVGGEAAQLLLELHGRPASIAVEGDERPLAAWREATVF